MDKIIDAEKEIINAIAGTVNDAPVLMINQNRYKNVNTHKGTIIKSEGQ